MRRWIALVVAPVLASGALAQSAADISSSPVRALVLGLGLMTLTIIGSLLLFMLSGWDDGRHHR